MDTKLTKITNKELARGLRALAQVYDDNPEIAQIHGGTAAPMLVFCHDAPVWHATVRAFGPGIKGDDNDWLEYKPTNLGISLKVFGYKPGVCTRVIRRKLVPAQVIPAQDAREAQPERVVPAHEEDVTEWICAPFTLPAEDPAEDPAEEVTP